MPTNLTVTRTEELTPSLRRVWFRSDDLSAFAESRHTDRYVKLLFPQPGTTIPDDFDARAARATWAPQDLPTIRTYTALFPDAAAGTLAIDFVIHGDEGVAGPWAAGVGAGVTILANGPGGAYSPDPEADWHLLAGDESAVPAISAALAALPADATGECVVLVDSAEHEPSLEAPEGVGVHFLHRDGSERPLTAAVRALPWREGRVHAFVHGEGDDVMKGVRPYLLTERSVPRSDTSISAYWRRGRTEEGFRVWKSELPTDG